MKKHISIATLALGVVSGGATAGPLADLLGSVTGGTGLTAPLSSGINAITGGFNESPLSALTTLPTVDPSGDSLVGLGAFEGDASGNGQLIGIGAGNALDANGAGNSGNGGLIGLGALSGSDSGNSNGGLASIGALSGSDSGNGGLIGLSALSDGGNSGQGNLLGVEALNGDTLLGLNSGLADQNQQLIPNPTGVSGTALNDAVGEPLRDGLQSALQREGTISGPLEQVVTTLDSGLVAPLGDALAPVTDQLAGLAGLGLDSSGQAPGFGGLASALVTGNNSDSGNDISAGVISGESGQGNGDLIGAGAFTGDNSGGNGIASVGAISGGNSGKGGDANVGVANSGEGATSNGGGLLSAGVAGSNTPSTGGPGGPLPKPPVTTGNPLVGNGQADDECGVGNDEEAGLKGPAAITQFNRRSAKEDCQTKVEKVASKDE